MLTECLKKNNKVIGSLGVEKYELEDKLTEFDGYKGRAIGCVLSREYWGQGLAPEAISAVIDFLFDEFDLDFLIACHFDFNIRSKNMQANLGFKPYRKIKLDTATGNKDDGVLNLLINPNKKIKFDFSHPETLIYEDK